MDVLRKFSATVVLVLLLQGCYYIKSAYHQVDLITSRIPAEKALQDSRLSESDRSKIKLAQEVMRFSETELGLKTNGNYQKVVLLDRPSVSYVVNAAPRWKLEHHYWTYPFLGKLPYRGYFNEPEAREEAKSLEKQGLDTHVRGVSAYSTLGWLQDPLLSSMLSMKEHHLVNTLIHESVHVTIYIKSQADFNERLAVFLGNWGTEKFYKEKEGPQSETVKLIQAENADDLLFSKFIGKELSDLESWYNQAPAKDEETRKKRIREIQDRFKLELAPHLKTKNYERFPQIELNNARLMLYRTYVQDLSVFEGLAQKVNGDYRKFLDEIKKFEKHSDPEQALKQGP